MPSDEEGTMPEPFDVKAGFEMMQEQFSNMMMRMEETARKVDAVASEQTVLRDEVTRTPVKDSPSKTKAVLGRKIPLLGLSGSPAVAHLLSISRPRIQMCLKCSKMLKPSK